MNLAIGLGLFMPPHCVVREHSPMWEGHREEGQVETLPGEAQLFSIKLTLPVLLVFHGHSTNSQFRKACKLLQ